MIAHEVFVYDGHFAIPLVAAIGHAQKASDQLQAGALTEALAEAQQAVALAPKAVNPNVVLGDVLAAMGQRDEARKSYVTALNMAQTVEPDFQVEWVATLQKKLAERRQRASDRRCADKELRADGFVCPCDL